MDPATRRDITGRADIEQLVNTFYDKIRKDDLLGFIFNDVAKTDWACLLYTSPSPRDRQKSRMPSSA